MQVGNNCPGTLNVSGTGFVNMPYDSIILGTSGGGTGVINLDGGTLLTTSISMGAGSGTVNFNGGVLEPAAASTTFMQGLTAANVKSGGAKITNDTDITIGQTLLHAGGDRPDGGLTKAGIGTLTLSGALSYNGDTKVNEGTLTITDTGGLYTPTATVHVADSAILNAPSIVCDTLSIGGPATAAAVPEPSTLILLTIAGLLALVVRKHPK
jgi:autotransporter-associated beta strand protein